MNYLLALIMLLVFQPATFIQPTAQPAAPDKPAAAVPQAAAPLVIDQAPIKAAMEKYIKAVGLPGASLSLRHEGAEILHLHVGNYSDATTVMIASASKWLTGATIMALVDQGLIDLDAPASTYLPDFKGDKAAITVRQMMSHTSGLPGDDRGVQDVRITIEKAAERAAKLEMAAKPGAEFRYGGVSMQVAGRVAEVVAKKPFRDVFRETIADPLQLTSTTYGRFAVGQNPNLAGGARSSLNDYAKFVQMIADGGVYQGRRVLSEEAVRVMCADQTGGAALKSGALNIRTQGARYGIGNWVNSKDAEGNGIVNSSPGAFGFMPWIDRERGVVGVFMIEDRERDRQRAERRGEAPDLQAIVNAEIDKALKARDAKK